MRHFQSHRRNIALRIEMFSNSKSDIVPTNHPCITRRGAPKAISTCTPLHLRFCIVSSKRSLESPFRPPPRPVCIAQQPLPHQLHQCPSSTTIPAKKSVSLKPRIVHVYLYSAITDQSILTDDAEHWQSAFHSHRNAVEQKFSFLLKNSQLKVKFYHAGKGGKLF
jgi:hypothetical protein